MSVMESEISVGPPQEWKTTKQSKASRDCGHESLSQCLSGALFKRQRQQLVGNRIRHSGGKWRWRGKRGNAGRLYAQTGRGDLRCSLPGYKVTSAQTPNQRRRRLKLIPQVRSKGTIQGDPSHTMHLLPATYLRYLGR